ncbi:MAG TPA: peptidoglycan-binding domain-containing protein [Alphaproteobacteria bacterium]|nr:peptidoglycan-binding domain-containing protein [Alphaproteobacteria bacterium]
MPEGMFRAYVTGTKEELQLHGYHPGHAAGILDPQTRAAIRQYQKDARLPVDGCVSKELLDHLKFHTPKIYAAGVSPRDSLIAAIQQELQKRGYAVGAIDGKAGPRTLGAIRQFERDAGLLPDAAIDQALLSRLRTTDPSIRAH